MGEKKGVRMQIARRERERERERRGQGVEIVEDDDLVYNIYFLDRREGYDGGFDYVIAYAESGVILQPRWKVTKVFSVRGKLRAHTLTTEIVSRPRGREAKCRKFDHLQKMSERPLLVF